MTQILAVEPEDPVTLWVFVRRLSDETLPAAAVGDGTPARAGAEIRKITLGWLNTSSYSIWPKADNRVTFDWSALSAVERSRRKRLHWQFLRANIDPTECCVARGVGTTKYRLYPEGSGFTNLIIAGEAAHSGSNTSSVEGAVMTAWPPRARSAAPLRRSRTDLLTRKPSDGL